MRLLIVEDDPDGREILAELFRRHEWRVVAVATGEAALSELRSGGIDMVISDENLEGGSGSAMLRDGCARGAALGGRRADVHVASGAPRRASTGCACSTSRSRSGCSWRR